MKKCLFAVLSIALLTGSSGLQAQQANEPDARRTPREESQLRERQLKQRDATKQTNKTNVEQLAAWLAMANHAEVQISQLATERAQNEQVKQFAENMIKAHSKCQEKLRKFMPQAESRLEANEPKTKRKASKHHSSMMQVGVHASKNKIKMTTDMLEEYRGQDFDMGYLGQQIVAHIDMLATLHAMKEHGTPEFQQVVKQGIQETEAHLKQAKGLALKLEDKERGIRSERSR